MISVKVVTILNSWKSIIIKLTKSIISDIYFYLLLYGVKFPLCQALKKVDCNFLIME